MKKNVGFQELTELHETCSLELREGDIKDQSPRLVEEAKSHWEKQFAPIGYTWTLENGSTFKTYKI